MRPKALAPFTLLVKVSLLIDPDGTLLSTDLSALLSLDHQTMTHLLAPTALRQCRVARQSSSLPHLLG